MLRALLGACATMAIAMAPHAQTLQGVILDGESGAPLPGATVYAPTLSAGTASGPDGRYSLALRSTGAVRVVFSFVGYKTETRSVDARAGVTTLDIVLTPSFVEAPAVTVTARAGASDVLSTPQSVEVLDAAAVARAAAGSPLDALDDVAGVRLLTTGPGIAKPVVRGLTGTRVLLVQDGIRQEGQYWGDEHGPEVSASDVDGIEVVRGPSSLLYGSDALGGVVQTTRRSLFAGDAPVRGELGMRAASGTPLGATDVEIGGRAGAWAWEGRLDYLRAGQVGTPDDHIENTAQARAGGSARLGYRFAERSTLTVEASRFDARMGLFEPAEEGDEPEHEEHGRFEIGEPFMRAQHDRAAARLDLPLGANRVEAVAAVQRNRLREFGHEHGGGEPEPEPHDEDEEPALYLRLTTATADVRFHHRPVGRVFGTAGVSGLAQTNETLGEETLIPGATTLSGGAYVTQHLVLPTVTLDAGVRVDARQMDVRVTPDLDLPEQKRSWIALTGAVGAAWQPRSDLSLAANLGRAFRAPTLQELFARGVHEGTLRFERGDPDLDSETAISIDGVIRYLTPHMFAEASMFVNHLDGFIFARPTPETDSASGLQVFDYGQADARLAGAEARFDIHPHALHGLGVHLSGDVTWGTNLETDEPLPTVPPARLRAAVEYRAGALGRVRDSRPAWARPSTPRSAGRSCPMSGRRTPTCSGTPP